LQKPRFLPALVLSLNMMMHIFHYWSKRVGKHVGNWRDEFSLWQWISATSVISMHHTHIVRFLFFFIHKNKAVVANAFSSEESSILWSRRTRYIQKFGW